jgi:hypothetical protein
MTEEKEVSELEWKLLYKSLLEQERFFQENSLYRLGMLGNQISKLSDSLTYHIYYGVVPHKVSVEDCLGGVLAQLRMLCCNLNIDFRVIEKLGYVDQKKFIDEGRVRRNYYQRD